jgi:hypothetical protein
MADRVDGDLLREIEAGRFPGPALGAVSYSAMAREIRTRRAEDKKQAADAALAEHLIGHRGVMCEMCYVLRSACREARQPPAPTDAERLEAAGFDLVGPVASYSHSVNLRTLGDLIVRRREERR